MDSYSAAMTQPQQPPPHQQSPRGVTLEDRPPNSHRRNDSQFGSHDDFYAFLDNNRGPSMASAGPGAGPVGPSASERSPPPAPMPPQQQQQQQQQRTLPSQSRPPVTNIFPDRSRPPSYSGSRSEELLVDKNAGAKMARQNQRRGAGPPAKPVNGPRQRTSSPTPPVSGGSSPTHPHNSRPVSRTGDRDGATGPVQRLKSPSVLECVLQPLDQKVREYEQLMRREQEEIRRLDDELRVLQARRAEAEGRFDEAKAKFDEYRRQYTDVERAMTGDLPMSPRDPQQQHQQQQQRPATMQGAGPMAQQRPMSARRFGDDMEGEDFEDDEDFQVPPPIGAGRRINSQQSFSRASQKTGKERFRFSSLFGGGR